MISPLSLVRHALPARREPVPRPPGIGTVEQPPVLVPRLPLRTVSQRAVDYVLAAGDADGLYRTSYPGGPLHAAAASIALNHLGLKTADFYSRDASRLETLAAAQNPDGSFSPFAGAPPSRDLTALAALAVRMAKQNGNPQAERFQPVLDRAAAFLRDGKGHENPLVSMIYGLMHDICLPDEKRVSPAFNPLTPRVATFLLHARVGQKLAGTISVASTILMPAMAILNHAVHETGVVHTPLPGLTRDVLDRQDPNGGWAYVALATALNVMALQSQGMTADDPAVAKGVHFIDSLDRSNGKASFLAAELWDTAVAGQVLVASGTPASNPRVSRMIDRLLAERGPQGLWSFSAGAAAVPDSDSSAAVAQFLTRAYPTASPHQQPAIRAAVVQAARELVGRQQKDGGYNAWLPTPWRLGRRAAKPMEAALMDPSTPDVTGRVLGFLVAASHSGLLDADLQKDVNRSIGRSIDYLKHTQTGNGSWWSRWIAGYLGAPCFIMGPLRATGTDMNAPWVQDVRSFLARHQNADGGWGEEVAADGDRALAGQGPSTPAQTAFGLLASVAASPVDDVRGDRSMARAAAWLEEHCQNGTWTNGKPIYTSIPQLDYYDAPFMTHCITTLALQAYRTALSEGADAAVARMFGEAAPAAGRGDLSPP